MEIFILFEGGGGGGIRGGGERRGGGRGREGEGEGEGRDTNHMFEEGFVCNSGGVHWSITPIATIGNNGNNWPSEMTLEG